MSKAKTGRKLKAETLVAAVVEAVEQFLQHSRNPAFLHSCLQLLQASSVEGAKENLAIHSWALLHRKLGVAVPGDVALRLEASGLLSEEEVSQLRRNQEDCGGPQQLTQASQNSQDFFFCSQQSLDVGSSQVGSQIHDDALTQNAALEEEAEILCLQSIPAESSSTQSRDSDIRTQTTGNFYLNHRPNIQEQQQQNFCEQTSQVPLDCGASSSQMLSLFQTPESQLQSSSENVARNCASEIQPSLTQASELLFQSQEVECGVQPDEAATQDVIQNLPENSNSPGEVILIQPPHQIDLLTPPGSQNQAKSQPLCPTNELEYIQSQNSTPPLDTNKTISISDSSFENDIDNPGGGTEDPAVRRLSPVQPRCNVGAKDSEVSPHQNTVTDDSVEVTSMYEVCSNQNASRSDHDVNSEVGDANSLSKAPSLPENVRGSRSVVRMALSAPLFRVGEAGADTTGENSTSSENRTDETMSNESSSSVDEEIFMTKEVVILRSTSTARADIDPRTCSRSNVRFGSKNLGSKNETNGGPSGREKEEALRSLLLEGRSLESMQSVTSEQIFTGARNIEIDAAVDSPIRRNTNDLSKTFLHRALENEISSLSEDSNDDGSTLEEIFESFPDKHKTKQDKIQLHFMSNSFRTNQTQETSLTNVRCKTPMNELGETCTLSRQKSIPEGKVSYLESGVNHKLSPSLLASTEYSNLNQKAFATELPSPQSTARTPELRAADAQDRIVCEESWAQNAVQKSQRCSQERDILHASFSSSSSHFDVSINEALRLLESPLFGDREAQRRDGSAPNNGSFEDIFTQILNPEMSFRTSETRERSPCEKKTDLSPENFNEEDIFTSISPIPYKFPDAKKFSTNYETNQKISSTNFNEVDVCYKKSSSQKKKDTEGRKFQYDRDWFPDFNTSIHSHANESKHTGLQAAAAGWADEAPNRTTEHISPERRTNKNDEWQSLFEEGNSRHSHSCSDSTSLSSQHNDSTKELQIGPANLFSTSPDSSSSSTEEIWGTQLNSNRDTSENSPASKKHCISRCRSALVNRNKTHPTDQSRKSTPPRGCPRHAYGSIELRLEKRRGANCSSERSSNLSCDSVQSQSLLDNAILEPFL